MLEQKTTPNTNNNDDNDNNNNSGSATTKMTQRSERKKEVMMICSPSAQAHPSGIQQCKLNLPQCQHIIKPRTWPY